MGEATSGTNGAGSAPRLKDVAEAAGVSVKTVSNVVNGTVHVAAATRTRVQAAIDALGYTPTWRPASCAPAAAA